MSATAQTRSGTWSLRNRLLTWFGIGILLIFSANLVTSYFTSRDATDSAYDRLLLASATAIAERTALREDGLLVDLPFAALDMLASTAQDRVFYAVLDPAGDVITGYDDLPAPDFALTGEAPGYYDARYRGATVRIVALRSFVSGANLSGYATILVGQTRGERDSLTFQLALQSATWTLVVAAMTFTVTLVAIAIGLQPLNRLQEAMGRRSPEDTRPILHDVPSEFAPLVGAINAMLGRLEGGLLNMQRFISDASHQLKTPLAGLQTQTELALREDDPDALRKSLSMIDVSAKRTSRLAQQLLSHARASDHQESHKPFDLAELCRSMIGLMMSPAQSKQIDLGFDGPDQLSFIGDQTLLGELLINLIDNALRYSPDGTMVTVHLDATERGIMLCVEDEGPGIPEDARESVFERFVRLNSLDQQGCGLGLAIVRQIVKNHRGQITLNESERGGLLVKVIFETDGEDPA